MRNASSAVNWPPLLNSRNNRSSRASILDRGIKWASEDRVATAVLTQMFGSVGGLLMAAAIMLSSFGCNNGLILAGAAAADQFGPGWADAGRVDVSISVPQLVQNRISGALGVWHLGQIIVVSKG